MARAQLSFGEVHYLLEPSQAGPTAPVVMLSNSLGADLHMWDGQMDALRQGFRVLRYDTRGHGASAVPDGPYTLEALATDAIELLDRLALPRVHFCGLSMGGLIGQWLGIHQASRVERLVICNSAAKIGTAATWNSRIDAVREGGMAAIADAVLARWFTASYRSTASAQIAGMATTLAATDPRGYVGCCAAIRDVDLRESLGAIRAPTLVVSGTVDEATPVQDAHFLAERIAAAAYVELQAAHISNVEQAAQFNSALLGFLEGRV